MTQTASYLDHFPTTEVTCSKWLTAMRCTFQRVTRGHCRGSLMFQRQSRRKCFRPTTSSPTPARSLTAQLKWRSACCPLSMTFHDFPLFLSVVISPSSSTSLSPIFSFQPVHHDRYNKGCGMCYPVCGMVHIKEPLLLIGKSSPCGSSGIPLSLSEWSFTICPTPYNRN